MLKHRKGNLLDLAEAGEFDVVVHGCNCFNTMGGGIAREIRNRWPEAARVDSSTPKGSYLKLGNWTEALIISEENRFQCINAYTQFNISAGQDVFEYSAFALILQKVEHAYGDKRIGLPYIGMGLAGGKKDVIIPMIEYFAKSIADKGGTVTLVEFA